MLVNSLASSASSGDITTSLLVSLPNSADARFVPVGVRDETICGSSNSSVIALPSAIRSGQNATSICSPSPASIFSTSAVTPGNTVLRRIEQLAVPQVVGAAAERPGDRRLVGVQVLIHRRADDHHHVLRRGHDRGIGRGLQTPGAEHPVQHLVRAGLGERHPARVHRGDGGLAHVIDAHLGTPVGERERERQAHVPAPADDNHVSADLIRQIRHRAYLRLIVAGLRRPPDRPPVTLWRFTLPPCPARYRSCYPPVAACLSARHMAC